MLEHCTSASLVAAVLLVGCGTSPTSQPPSTQPPAAQVPGPQTQAIAARLAAQGATVSFAEAMASSSHPYFAVPAARYQVNGENLYAFEYGSPAEAASAAAGIAPDGRLVGNTQVEWVSEPHFSRSDAVVGLYVGREKSTLTQLERVLGPQVAGAGALR